MKNVLIFMCDQLRKDSLGCYGNPYASTPNLDRLAQNSLRFTRNYAANPNLYAESPFAVHRNVSAQSRDLDKRSFNP